jgi:hypothetical protein
MSPISQILGDDTDPRTAARRPIRGGTSQGEALHPPKRSIAPGAFLRKWLADDWFGWSQAYPQCPPCRRGANRTSASRNVCHEAVAPMAEKSSHRIMQDQPDLVISAIRAVAQSFVENETVISHASSNSPPLRQELRMIDLHKGKRRPGLDFRVAWDNMCTAVGVQVLWHDFRRTAVRTMVRARVSENVARKFSGHKARSVFDRYDITNQSDVIDAAKKPESAEIGGKISHRENATASQQSAND